MLSSTCVADNTAWQTRDSTRRERTAARSRQRPCQTKVRRAGQALELRQRRRLLRWPQRSLYNQDDDQKRREEGRTPTPPRTRAGVQASQTPSPVYKQDGLSAPNCKPRRQEREGSPKNCRRLPLPLISREAVVSPCARNHTNASVGELPYIVLPVCLLGHRVRLPGSRAFCAASWKMECM